MKKFMLMLTLLLGIVGFTSCSEEFNGEKVDAIIENIHNDGYNEKDLKELLVQFEACVTLRNKIYDEYLKTNEMTSGMKADLDYLNPYFSEMANTMCYSGRVEREFPEIYKEANKILAKSLKA